MISQFNILLRVLSAHSPKNGFALRRWRIAPGTFWGAPFAATLRKFRL